VTECHTCELTRRRDAGNAPLWDNIYQTEHWDVAHSYNTALPGWLVLISRIHHKAIADLSEAEAVELGPLIRRVSLALQAVTGCEKTYVVQFAEAAGHGHVHFHVVPRMADLPDDHRGPDVFKYLGVDEAERVSEAEMNAIALAVRERLQEKI
jgi:diadenosine tetraphosphate (Ap4A) HIT family hydrolase